MDTKVCSKCKYEKPLSEFYKESNAKNGYRSECISCRKKYKQSTKYKRLYAEYMKEYRKKHRDYFSNYQKKRWNKKYYNDPMYRLTSLARREVSDALKGKSYMYMDNILRGGYTVQELRNHIEQQFHSGMSWKNYGIKWCVDHIYPVSSFNYQDETDPEFLECWKLENLRPLKNKENQKKHHKVIS